MRLLQFFQRVLKRSYLGQNASRDRIVAHNSKFEAVCACASKIPRQQYLWTRCQSVVPNDFPRDFCPWVAFVSYGSDTYRHRQAGRDREISQPLDHIYIFFKEPFIITLEDSLFTNLKSKKNGNKWINLDY